MRAEIVPEENHLTPRHQDDDLDSDVFGPLTSIPVESLVRLATRIKKDILGTATSDGWLVSKFAGSYTIIHIIQLDDTRLVIRVPATDGETTIPVPLVYDFDTNTDNDINAPYICMSYIPGRIVATSWFGRDSDKAAGSTAMLEERRLRILAGIAKGSDEFARFTFNKIGSIHCEETMDISNLDVGPCYDGRENEDGTLNVTASGPFSSTQAYLETHTFNDNGIRALDLSILYFDSQNILVDDNDCIAGVIDWDLAQTLPRLVGYARCPSWITRDWDPLMYGWPKDTETENSPEELQWKARGWGGDWRYSKISHITEAVWLAALSPINRLEICRKLI
ncbi:hypothetical protein QBC46DRAFT_427112 [Diplogelasinospora grovesii]|uniref:Aminoglycoside phosphotransferase domain-containing protein n=1 Tax=Diplogelasinospora grovesii TaxID=303347 RepID=A0AAN6MX21_9PEZI|nr:hypothetical protein QBC46DRAFT_427112 [Diplogelasinospora grovesii]